MMSFCERRGVDRQRLGIRWSCESRAQRCMGTKLCNYKRLFTTGLNSPNSFLHAAQMLPCYAWLSTESSYWKRKRKLYITYIVSFHPPYGLHSGKALRGKFQAYSANISALAPPTAWWLETCCQWFHGVADNRPKQYLAMSLFLLLSLICFPLLTEPLCTLLSGERLRLPETY